MNYDEYNALGQAIDTTWGRSSTAGTRDNASMSVKPHLLGENQLVLTYTTIISFGDISEREREIKRYGDEANGVLDAALARIKRDFKELPSNIAATCTPTFATGERDARSFEWRAVTCAISCPITAASRS